jgi:hypothetical protein
LTILDSIVSDIEQANIDSCAEVFEVWLLTTVCPLLDCEGHLCYDIRICVFDSVYADGWWCRGGVTGGFKNL